VTQNQTQDQKNRPGQQNQAGQNQAGQDQERKDKLPGQGQDSDRKMPGQGTEPGKKDANPSRSGQSNSKDDERGEPGMQRPGQGNSDSNRT
jgi:hypothetical protein